MQTTHEILVRTKAASRALASVGQADKERLLLCMADSLLAREGDILAANARDMAASAGVITPVMADRLLLTDKRIAGMAQGVRDVAHLPDPVGEVLSEVTRPNGMVIRKVRVPFGLIAIIYESRPNVTSDAVALALRSGNACVLRCGKEAHATCLAVMAALKAGIAAAEVPGVSPDCINLLEDTSRASATELMTADGLVDLLIPRGGAGLIRACVENATVPCIQTGTGICHVYVDKSADLDMAVRIMVNAKTSRPSVCNAAEVCLVHRAMAADFLSIMAFWCWTNGIYNATSGLFQGTGHTEVTMIVDAARLWVFRFMTLFFCESVLHMGVRSVWYSVVVSNAISSFILYVVYRTNIWKKSKIKVKGANA